MKEPLTIQAIALMLLHRFYRISLALIGLIIAGLPARGMIFYSTPDPAYNTTAPTGALANSGWQWVGSWGGFTGTVIGPHHFLSANHVGGSVGDSFILNGLSYTTVAVQHDTVTDLAVWEVSQTFSSWASLYRLTDEVGKPLLVFGRGLSRGAEVRVSGVLKGWMWGSDGGLLRWGKNTVAAITNAGAGLGSMLYATFDFGAGPDECHLATGDSSGPIFIQDGSEWKVAGIAYAVDAYFNTTNSGDGFIAALFDISGLYYSTNGNWQLATASQPTGFYASRISARLAWIDGITQSSSASDVPALPFWGLSALCAAFLISGAVALRQPSALPGNREDC